ncbi:sigma-70 family RNA polymerase sigma factor [Streptomyces sp. NPDC046887]|uniref:RNA polymerase sigma factor n=1 Tax=Streptomyces sp. NPDC046887 TaxID=3155472 RepID=UPI003401BA29
MADDDAYEVFFEEQYPRVVAMLIAYRGFAPEIAEEAAAEAMIRLYGRWHTVRSPRAWVRTVALRVAVGLAADRPMGLPEWEVADGRPAEELEAALLALAAGTAAAKLPPRQREVMALALADLSPAEIAETLGSTPEQVRGNLAHARRTMRTLMEMEEG